jgi:membrane protease YdiL (CAAX protease family)
MVQPGAYLGATRHPWPCLLFLAPLLITYEAGVLVLGGPNPETVRNGADHWLRAGLQACGVGLWWVPPLLLGLAFCLWAWWRWSDRPGDLIGVLSGMVLESVTFALGLWALSRVLAPLLVRFGVEMSVPVPFLVEAPSPVPADATLRQFITYLGAGIYEETLFRLLLFSILLSVAWWLELGQVLGVGVAALGSAILFSAAHHVGPYGQAYSNYLFVFRLVAGLYFALLYRFRGFGIVVGAHACYNEMVSIT